MNKNKLTQLSKKEVSVFFIFCENVLCFFDKITRVRFGFAEDFVFLRNERIFTT